MSLSFFLSSPATYSERRFPLDTALPALKARIEQITGIPIDAQRLSAYHSAEECEAEARRRRERDGVLGGADGGVLSVRSGRDEGMTLGDLGVGEFGVLRVDDDRSPSSSTGPSGLGSHTIDNADAEPELAPGQRFELSQADYEARSDTVLAQLKARKMGRFAEPSTAHAGEAGGAEAGEGEQGKEHVPADLVVGARCLVLPPSGHAAAPGGRGNNPFSLMPVLSLGAPSSSRPTASASSAGAAPGGKEEDAFERRGTVRFVGTTEFGDVKTQERTVWVGVELDEPVGRNDGSVAGKRYFPARPSHGVFVRPDRVRVGAYPEVDVAGEEEEDDFEGLDEI